MKILAVGDVAGSAGVDWLGANLRRIKTENNADIVIVNGENSADTNGITAKTADALFQAGADVITGGNHSLRHKDIFQYMDDNPRLIRPQNLTDEPIGSGYVIIKTMMGNVMVVSLMGQTYMSAADSPFKAMDSLLKREKDNFDILLVDIHAEATSEKLAFLHQYSKAAAAIWGTHTHVQTADEQIVNGCAYITDLGMCGAKDSILGARSDIIVKRFVTRLPEKFVMAAGEVQMCGALIELDKANRAVSIKRIKEE